MENVVSDVAAPIARPAETPADETSHESQAVDTTQLPNKFEPQWTLEGLRKQIAQFAHERDWEQHHTPRNLVLALSGEMGELCECFQWKGDHISVDDWSPAEREHLGEELSDVAIYLIRLADRCNIDLGAAIQDKMIKNVRKYPAHLVNGSSQKYTAYERKGDSADTANASSSATQQHVKNVVADAAASIAPTAETRHQTQPLEQAQPTDKFEPQWTLEGLRKQIMQFVHERNWAKNHTPRNLVLALSGEVGELCECFQWKGDHVLVDEWSPDEREHLGEELSDVAIYLIQLADRCNIDLGAAIQDKMIKNARKYPAHLVNGSSQKYTAYEQKSDTTETATQH